MTEFVIGACVGWIVSKVRLMSPEEMRYDQAGTKTPSESTEIAPDAPSTVTQAPTGVPRWVDVDDHADAIEIAYMEGYQNGQKAARVKMVDKDITGEDPCDLGVVTPDLASKSDQSRSDVTGEGLQELRAMCWAEGYRAAALYADLPINDINPYSGEMVEGKYGS